MKTPLRHCKRIMCAFVVGQAAQVALFIIANITSHRPTLWAAAAGFILALAVFAGMGVVSKELNEAEPATRSARSRSKED